jgi:hypothetical protein
MQTLLYREKLSFYLQAAECGGLFLLRTLLSDNLLFGGITVYWPTWNNHFCNSFTEIYKIPSFRIYNQSSNIMLYVMTG